MNPDIIELWKQQLQNILNEMEDANNRDLMEAFVTIEQAIEELDNVQ